MVQTPHSMKKIIFILTFLTTLFYAQANTGPETEVEEYVKKIDKLKAENKLKKISYPDMSSCGGGVDGYYLDKQLVLIDAIYQAELGYSSKTIYLDNSRFLHIIYREHFAEWEKYFQKYPSDKHEFDASKMTYTDTLYTITLTAPVIFRKQAQGKTISNQNDQALVDELLKCGEQMKKELSEVTEGNKPR
jgi:hypothetical protein